MAGFDYGYIPIHNKRLGFMLKGDTGAGSPYCVGNMQFYKCHAEKLYLMSENEDEIFINFEQELDWQDKMVVYWEYQTIQYKTKRIGERLYLTTFKHRGMFKKLIHGYDVDMEYCHDPKRLKKIKKLVRKLTR